MDKKLEQLKEYAKIIKDTPYALRTYLKTYDNTQQKFVPFDLFPDQVQLVYDYEHYNENITKKYRQAGVSTVTAAWVSKILQTADPQSPQKILVVANKKDTAVELTSKIRNFLTQWPDWINVGFDPSKDSQSWFKLKNGCEVKGVATSNDALRGYTPTCLIFDEAAYIEAGEDFWAACMASLSTGGKVIVISTPNGIDSIYYPIYDQALNKLNDFHITDLRWYYDPRYAKDLVWIKCNDMVHYMLNKEDYKGDDLFVYENNRENFQHLFESGYKPYSSWYEKMSKKLKFDRRKIAQEIETTFNGSGDNVIPSDIVDNIKKNMLREPIEKYMSGELWVWKYPIEGHRYIMGLDVSRGDSEDYSAINIIDFDDSEQVLEYIGKIPPDDLATIAYKWGKIYSAFCVIDITGGMGIATSRKLQEFGYKDMFIDGINTKDIWTYDQKILDKIPGINFNNKRTQIIATFEEQLRHNFLIRSERLINEANTFVFINGRPDHMKGCHDDAIMSIAIAMYAGEICFAQLTRNENKNKAMLEAWAMSERTYDPKKSFYSYGTAFDSIGSMFLSGGNHRNNPIDTSKEAYQKYSWLFGKPPA